MTFHLRSCCRTFLFLPCRVCENMNRKLHSQSYCYLHESCSAPTLAFSFSISVGSCRVAQAGFELVIFTLHALMWEYICELLLLGSSVLLYSLLERSSVSDQHHLLTWSFLPIVLWYLFGSVFRFFYLQVSLAPRFPWCAPVISSGHPQLFMYWMQDLARLVKTGGKKWRGQRGPYLIKMNLNQILN